VSCRDETWSAEGAARPSARDWRTGWLLPDASGEKPMAGEPRRRQLRHIGSTFVLGHTFAYPRRACLRMSAFAHRQLQTGTALRRRSDGDVPSGRRRERAIAFAEPGGSAPPGGARSLSCSSECGRPCRARLALPMHAAGAGALRTARSPCYVGDRRASHWAVGCVVPRVRPAIGAVRKGIVRSRVGAVSWRSSGHGGEDACATRAG
jgi:hypothetical protein